MFEAAETTGYKPTHQKRCGKRYGRQVQNRGERSQMVGTSDLCVAQMPDTRAFAGACRSMPSPFALANIAESSRLLARNARVGPKAERHARTRSRIEKKPHLGAAFLDMVGSAGLEPATPCVSCKCSTPELTARDAWGTGGAYTS